MNSATLSLLPTHIKSLISDRKWEQKTEGQSGDHCYFVGLDNGHSAYLKSYEGLERTDYKNEIEIIKWLDGKMPTAHILAHGANRNCYFILWSEVKGHGGHELIEKSSLESFVKLCATTLKKLHSIPITYCPVEKSLRIKIVEALQNMEKGYVDLEDLDESRQGWSLERLKKELLTTTPLHEDLVFTHGDFCLPNMIFQNEKLSGLIDLGRAGIADRYQDIALLLRSLNYNSAQSCDQIFLNHYDLIDSLDYQKIAFYQLLDEFF